MAEKSKNERVSELAQELEDGPNRLTDSLEGEGTTHQPIIKYLDESEEIQYIFTASHKSIAIDNKSSGESLYTDGKPTYVFTDKRALGIMPKEDDDEKYEIHYDLISDVENNFGLTKWRTEIETDDKIYHLWISNASKRENLESMKEYLYRNIEDKSKESEDINTQSEHLFTAKKKGLKIESWKYKNQHIKSSKDSQSEFLFTDDSFIAKVPNEATSESFTVDYDSIYEINVSKSLRKSRVSIKTKHKLYTFWTKDELNKNKILETVSRNTHNSSTTIEDLLSDDENINDSYDLDIKKAKIQSVESDKWRKLEACDDKKRIVFTDKRIILSVPKEMRNLNYCIDYEDVIDIRSSYVSDCSIWIYTEDNTYQLTSDDRPSNTGLYEFIYHKISGNKNNGIAEELYTEEEIKRISQSGKFGIKFDGERMKPTERLYAGVVCTNRRIIAYVPTNEGNEILKIDYSDICDIDGESHTISTEKITIKIKDDGYTKFIFWNRDATRSPTQFISNKTGIKKFKIVEEGGEVGTLRVEGWTDGSSDITADFEGSSESKGKSFGVQSGSFFASKTASKSSIEGDISGEISDNTYTTDITKLKIYNQNLTLESKIKLDIHLSEIDNIFKQQDGMVIEMDGTTFRIGNLPSDAKVSRAVSYVKDQMMGSEGRTENSGSNDGDEKKNTDSEDVDAGKKLRELKDLHEDGILTDEEFESKKKELLDDF